MATESILDKRFVGAAIAIGLAYSLIVVVLARLLGKDAAGVAAVALTALAAAIFKQFETLRFRQIPERESTVIFVQRLYSWYLLLLMFSFYGLSVVFWVLPGTLLHKVWRHSPPGYINYISLLLLVLSQFVGGFISGKTAPARRYSYAVFASVGVVFVNIIIQITESGFRDAIDALYAYISVSIIYPAVAVFGARWGFSPTAVRTAAPVFPMQPKSPKPAMQLAGSPRVTVAARPRRHAMQLPRCAPRCGS